MLPHRDSQTISLVQLRPRGARPPFSLALGQHDGEHAAVGNGAAADDGQALRARRVKPPSCPPIRSQTRRGRNSANLSSDGSARPACPAQIERCCAAARGTDRPCASRAAYQSSTRAWRPWRRPPRPVAPARRVGCGAASMASSSPCQHVGARSRRHRPGLRPRARIDQAAGRPAHLVPRTPTRCRALATEAAARPPGSPGPPGLRVHAQLQAGGGHHAPQRAPDLSASRCRCAALETEPRGASARSGRGTVRFRLPVPPLEMRTAPLRASPCRGICMLAYSAFSRAVVSPRRRGSWRTRLSSGAESTCPPGCWPPRAARSIPWCRTRRAPG